MPRPYSGGWLRFHTEGLIVRRSCSSLAPSASLLGNVCGEAVNVPTVVNEGRGGPLP